MCRKPNILLIMSDELRADVLGCYGNSIIRTPNIDKLASMASVFEHAYTPIPICIPARQCISAGQYPTTCNCKRWLDDLTEHYQTFPQLLSRYGYETVACGKLHHVGRDQMQGYTQRIGAECHIHYKYINAPVVSRSQDAIHAKWSQTKEVMMATDTAHATSYHIQQDELAIRGAEMFLSNYFVDDFYQRATPDVPLLLTVSFNQPHYPYVAAPEKLAYYMERVIPYENQTLFPHEFLSRFAVKVPRSNLLKATAAYYAMVEQVDDYVGRLLSALRAAKQNLEDWMIIFTSDHGEMLGQHGVWEKQKFFEGSVRVPLFIKLPKENSMRRITENVSTCDLFATICEAAKIPVPCDLDSRSLSGLIHGTLNCWDNECISMFDDSNIMVKRGSIKYQFYKSDQSEVLFDLDLDPTESRNLVSEPQYAEKIPEFRKRIREFGFVWEEEIKNEK